MERNETNACASAVSCSFSCVSGNVYDCIIMRKHSIFNQNLIFSLIYPYLDSHTFTVKLASKHLVKEKSDKT